jgi:hypothetical protein
MPGVCALQTNVLPVTTLSLHLPNVLVPVSIDVHKMSGRLVILPHKSWNVWNQDNREKVLRDERLHKEQEDAAVEKNNKLLQEQNLASLKGEEVSGQYGSNFSGDHVSDSLERFSLFDDIEKQIETELQNKERLKEIAAKEKAKKKKDGVDEWALGDGSYEHSKSKPWYEAVKIKDEPHEGSMSDVQELDTVRKRKADPMDGFLPQGVTCLPYSRTGRSSSMVDAVDFAESKEDLLEDRRSKSKSHKRSHGSREDEVEDYINYKSNTEKKKKKKEKLGETRGKERSKDNFMGKEKMGESSRVHGTLGHSPDELVLAREDWGQPSDQAGRNSNANDFVRDKYADLRIKRMEREALEKKRAAVLLASLDIYGSSFSAAGAGMSSYSYGQQFHPHLAKPHR